MSVYIIAEAGASHGGRLSTAVDLVHAAKEAGADCVKFQMWNTDKFISKSSKFYFPFKQLELSPISWDLIKAHCDKAGIDFMASAFDRESVDRLIEMGVRKIKIASADITHEPLIRYVASNGWDIILSTGMATSEEIERTLGWIYSTASVSMSKIKYSPSSTATVFCSPNLTLLKCTVDYPCSEDSVNLQGMQTLKKFGRPVGFSDHTKTFLPSCMAVAMGASVIEKHFSLEETEEAMSFNQFVEFVSCIRQSERILGSPFLGTFPCEEKWKPIARRGESGLRE